MTSIPALTHATESIADTLHRWVENHPRLFVLSGAGVSTGSGIPAYRDADGRWQQQQPITFQNFLASEHTRRRYWARSLIGWPRFAAAQPNTTHHVLAAMESAGYVHQLVTQNVDSLHQHAGSRRVIDLHGRLDSVECLDCRSRVPRVDVQRELVANNPEFLQLSANPAPDGDAQLDHVDFARFQIADCASCGGILKPRVVFFGENVPRPRVEHALHRLADADALLVLGSSLMVYSGYRFCKATAQQGKPIAAINLGRTRADDELALKIEAPCDEVLTALLERLS